MRDVYVDGIAVTSFGLRFGSSIKDMTREAIDLALADAQTEKSEVQAIMFGNCLSGMITGQEATRGPVACIPAGFGGIPIHSVEGSCATGATALHLAFMAVGSGMYDNVLAVGVEKVNVKDDRAATFRAYRSGLDQDENIEAEFQLGVGAGQSRSALVDRHAIIARRLMSELDLTVDDLATLTAISLANGQHNPIAHRQQGGGVAAVLGARMAVDPLTALMMSPVSDGSAAVLIRGADTRRSGVRIAASRAASRPRFDDPNGPSATETATSAAYAQAGITAQDLDLAELHDASIAYLIVALRESGICPAGAERDWIREGRTRIDGPMPVNTSGGTLARGHAIGATGLAQVAEIVMQLRGEAGKRQVRDPRLGLAHCGGGVIRFETAVAVSHILELV